MDLKSEIIFLTGVYKKLETLNTTSSKVNSVFNELCNTLKTEMQISQDAVDIVYSIFEVSNKPSVSIRKVESDPCSLGVRRTSSGC